jgi:hypothetical protein
MSVNLYDHASGKTLPLASGTRTWIGTRADYQNAKRDGTLPLNSLIAITDDEQGGEEGSLEAIIGKNAGARNSIFRGMNLGSQVTAEQYDAIDAGTFEGLMLGDYWEIAGVKYRIADFDYYYRFGNPSITKHHIIIVPDTILGGLKSMNATNTTTGGYRDTLMRSENLNDAKAIINSAFGANHLLTFKDAFTSTDGSGAISFTWVSGQVELMSEVQVYGNIIRGHYPWYEIGFSTQFALFQKDRSFIIPLDSDGKRTVCWLRSIASNSGTYQTPSTVQFVTINNTGLANNVNASASMGVRPYVVIYKG